MPIEAYLVIVALMLIGAVKVISEFIKFHHYDYRQEERTGISDRPKHKDEETKEIWIDNWEYDPETKSFKNKREPR